MCINCFKFDIQSNESELFSVIEYIKGPPIIVKYNTISLDKYGIYRGLTVLKYFKF